MVGSATMSARMHDDELMIDEDMVRSC